MKLKVVYGAPCSGKTTYVRDNIGDNDIVYDYDHLSRALTYGRDTDITHPYVIDFRLALLKRAKTETEIDNIWITATKLTDQFKDFVADMDPEYIEMDITKEQCIEQLMGDDSRPDKEFWTEKINEYYDSQEVRAAVISKDRLYRHFEVRANEAEAKIEGYALVYEQPTVMYTMGDVEYKEQIKRGALTNTEMSDVVLNFNHGGKPAARTKNRTLQLTPDNHGLHVVADLSGTEEGRRLYEEVRGGYLDKMSFAFSLDAETGDEYNRETHTRTITDIKRIYDVAIVDFPAYEQTSVHARNFFKAEAEREQAEARLSAEADRRARLLLTTIITIKEATT